MKKLPLRNGGYTLLDDEDAEWFSDIGWRVSLGYVVGPVIVSPGKSRDLRLHRLIMGARPGQVVDHINHDLLDNRRCNLRLATVAENSRNRRMQKNNKSGFKGVIYRLDLKLRNRFMASISVNGRTVNLGYFDSAIRAARAYDAAAMKYFGEFAMTNEKLGLLPAGTDPSPHQP